MISFKHNIGIFSEINYYIIEEVEQSHILDDQWCLPMSTEVCLHSNLPVLPCTDIHKRYTQNLSWSQDSRGTRVHPKQKHLERWHPDPNTSKDGQATCTAPDDRGRHSHHEDGYVVGY